MDVNFDGLRQSILNNFNRVVESIAEGSDDGGIRLYTRDFEDLAEHLNELRTDLVWLKNLMSESEGYTYLEKPDLRDIYELTEQKPNG